MPCFVPEQNRHLRWHIIQPTRDHAGAPHRFFEIAEWVNNEANGPNERGHWVRWGYCGDFPSLCQADYVGPVQDQDLLTQRMNEPKDAAA